ncbi:MAG TPA: hypothetical protein VF137_09055 [Candidatus Dormibacteraeota bacterium]
MQPVKTRGDTRDALALVGGIGAILLGIPIGWACGVFSQGAVFFIQAGYPAFGLAQFAVAIVGSFLLPGVALWLGATRRTYSDAGRVGWILGWISVSLILLGDVALYLLLAFAAARH